MRRKMVAAVGVLALALAGCGDDEKPPASPDDAATSPAHHETSSEPPAIPAEQVDVVQFEVAGSKRVKGPEQVEVKLGDEVVIEVTTDAPDQLHVHGYEKTLKIQPGKPALLQFTAHLAGVWEIELHEGGEVLTELRVAGG